MLSTEVFQNCLAVITMQCLQNLVNDNFNASSLDVYLDGKTDPTLLLKYVVKPVYITRISENGNIMWRNSSVDTVFVLEKVPSSLLIEGPRGRVVVVTSNPSLTINLWKTHGLLDLVVLTCSQSTKVNAYTWYPYRRDQCNKIPQFELIDECLIQQTWKNDLFPSKLRKRFIGCILNIMTYKTPPDLIQSDDGQIYGRDLLLIQAILNSLGFESNITLDSKIYYTSEVSPTGGVVDVLNGDVDYILGGLLKYNFFKWCEPLVVYREQRVVWMLPKPDPLPRFWQLFNGFPPTLWCTIILVCIVLSIIIAAIAHLEGTTSSWLNIVSGIASCPMPRIPQSFEIQAILMIFEFFALHVVWFYQSTILNSLFSQPMQKQLKTTKEALEAKLKPMIFEYVVQEIPQQEVLDVIHYNGYIADHLTHNYSIMIDEKIAFLHGFDPYDLWVIEKSYPGKRINDLVYIEEKIIERIGVTIYGRRGSPLGNLIHKKIIQILESGIYENWAEKEPKVNSGPHHSNKPLEIDILLGVFGLLAASLSLASVIFLLEFIWNKYKSQSTNKNQLSRRIDTVADKAMSILGPKIQPTDNEESNPLPSTMRSK